MVSLTRPLAINSDVPKEIAQRNQERKKKILHNDLKILI